MCGIFGVTGLDDKLLDKAHTSLHTLTHRGPDGWDYIHSNNIYLGHRRLSILDLSKNGKQPMSKDGVYLTVNGEIYNFKELNKELVNNHGVELLSSSDSETLLHGYIHWGIEKLLERIEGMFAFSIYDSNTGEIHIARDHAGIKPLYYSLQDNSLSWASELKALENYYGKSNLDIDYTAIYDFLSYSYIPSPKSLYKNIFKLEAAHYGTYNIAKNSFIQKRYWELPINRHISNFDIATKNVKLAIEREVKSHLIADVSIGTFLSGGVDSSIISYEVSRLVKVLNTCSIGFDDEKVDETEFSKLVADKIGSEHVTDYMDHNIVNSNFSMLRTLFDEPFGDTSAFPTYAVSKLAHQNMTVVLTGDGADELFGGYGHYTCWYQMLTPYLGVFAIFRPLISYLKNMEFGCVSNIAKKIEIFSIVNPLERRIRLSGGLLKTDKFKKRFRNKFDIPESYNDTWHTEKYYRKDLPLKSRSMYLDFHTSMSDDILCKVDRASMANSIETRVPFLSKSIVKCAWEIEENLLFKGNELKGLLKLLYINNLPKKCLYRSKQGFSLGATESNDELHIDSKVLPVMILEKLFKKEVS